MFNKAICYICKFFSHPQSLQRIIMGATCSKDKAFWEVKILYQLPIDSRWYSIILGTIWQRQSVLGPILGYFYQLWNFTSFLTWNLFVPKWLGLWYWMKYTYLTVLCPYGIFPSAYICFLDCILYIQPALLSIIECQSA